LGGGLPLDFFFFSTLPTRKQWYYQNIHTHHFFNSSMCKSLSNSWRSCFNVLLSRRGFCVGIHDAHVHTPRALVGQRGRTAC
jgi:hypothetical protein